MLSLLKIHPEVRETRKNWSNLTLSWRRSLSYWNQSIHLLCKPMDCFYMILTSAMKELKLVEYIRELLESLHCWNLRNSRPEVFCKEAVLRSFTKFTGKHLYQSLFFNKATGLRSSTLLKKRLWDRCFPVNFVKFLRIPFLTEYLWRLLLDFKNHRCKTPSKSIFGGIWD